MHPLHPGETRDLRAFWHRRAMLDSSQGIYPLGSYSSDLFCVALATNVFAETHSSAYDCQKRTMANTYTALDYHIVFSTKNREAWIRQDIEERVWEYLGGIARHNDIVPAKIGGIRQAWHRVRRAVLG